MKVTFLKNGRFGGISVSQTHLVCILNILFNPLPDDKISDWSYLKQIADDILKCIKNKKKKVPDRVENIARKGEIDCYKQFLFFSQCFPQLYTFRASKCGIVW